MRGKTWFTLSLLVTLTLAALPAVSQASDFRTPWTRADRALVLDAYEYTEIDWAALAGDKRVAGFINKASDGLPPAYRCSGEETELRLCKALWKRYAVARELFQTRRMIARTLGLKWGAYHLARPDNPLDQANHFVDFADPAPDELMALDLEGSEPSQWMSFADAEAFVRQIFARTGRYPLLYTNRVTARQIAAQADLYPLLSRLKLWYARYQPDIAADFPTGAWSGYALWQFSHKGNCNRRTCAVRIAGTGHDIDVNVSALPADALRKAWPFDGLINGDALLAATVPLPQDRYAPAGQTAWAPVRQASKAEMLAFAYAPADDRYAAGKTSAIGAPSAIALASSTMEGNVDALTTGTVPVRKAIDRRRFRR
jgi:GH25 family lysozyme M1 (1,4-beta-N-acetylmuramidase)